jgi:3'-phosphoadenosine 5'-phosphosulfate sulfotransferase (PAPS reductase)/FAD synthetase
VLTRAEVLGYDHVIVAFSGGKDSLACLLYLLFDLCIPADRIELVHHDVDGREGSTLMDWPCTRAYCAAIAEAFDVKLYYSWKEGGFEREMLRKDSPTAPIWYETPEGLRSTGGRGEPNTRGRFPQVSPDLRVRWCSAYLKIDVCAAAIRGQKRFLGKRVLVVTGERAEESASRARYKTFEPHRADLRAIEELAQELPTDPAGQIGAAIGQNAKTLRRRSWASRRRGPTRHVDQWRPIHGWSEAQVWALIEKHRVNPHPAYRLGWGRVSCAACIFGSPAQWASLRAVNPAQFEAVAAHERRSGQTIQRKLNVLQLADKGQPYAMSPADVRAALSTRFDEPVLLDAGAWARPRGAFGDSCGPT